MHGSTHRKKYFLFYLDSLIFTQTPVISPEHISERMIIFRLNPPDILLLQIHGRQFWGRYKMKLQVFTFFIYSEFTSLDVLSAKGYPRFTILFSLTSHQVEKCLIIHDFLWKLGCALKKHILGLSARKPFFMLPWFQLWRRGLRGQVDMVLQCGCPDSPSPCQTRSIFTFCTSGERLH